jgi:D-alanyl-lipoteichoic acid acyltransferase DltB (MBOAT superfamily)
VLLALALVLLFAPLYWALVPVRWRREALATASLGGLWAVDPRLVGLVAGTALVLHVALRVIGAGRSPRARAAAASVIAFLVALFLWNKLAGGASGVLPSQSGLALLGVSYLVLKASAVLVAGVRGLHERVRLIDLLAWLIFLPTYPSGPIEEFAHFRGQQPVWDQTMVMRGLERVLFGLVKTMLLSHYLGAWVAPILDDPEAQTRWALVLATYGSTLRFYFDFSGYSDIAIGTAAVFGVRIQENFDHPLTRRNLTLLWQRWHMTLTGWLRAYLFVPLSRALLRRVDKRFETAALFAAQAVTMTFCGLWHGLGWNFFVWGLLQAIGLIWVTRFARPLGAKLPSVLRSRWRSSRLGYAVSCLLTFHYFAAANVLVFCDIGRAVAYGQRLIGL